jgi:hypothetical protein
MPRQRREDEDEIFVERPKRRVKTPIKTGTIIHKSPKPYTRREKYRSRFFDTEEEEAELEEGRQEEQGE